MARALIRFHEIERSRRMSIFPSYIALTSLFVVLAAAPLLSQSATGSVMYVLEADMDGNPGGEWVVMQGPEISVARWSTEERPGEVALLAGPAVGTWPVEFLDDMGGVLSVLYEPMSDFGPGYRRTSPYAAGTAVVDSIRVELQEGTAHERIADHDARHHVLTAQIWWRHLAENGSETAVVDTGTADLWFAPDLPFSWLPLGVHPKRPGMALPLSFWWPEAADAAVAQLGEELEDLGLLLRSRTRDQTRPEEDQTGEAQLVGVELSSSLIVRDLRELDQAPDPAPFLRLPRLARSRVTALHTASFVLDACRTLQSAAGGSFQLAVSGPREFESQGSSLFLADDLVEEAYTLLVGGPRDDGFECTLFLIPGEAPRPGTFPLALPKPGLIAEGDSDHAVGLHAVAGGGALHRIMIVESGQIRLDEADSAGISGQMEGVGWALEPRAGRPPELLEELRMEMTFEAAPASMSKQEETP